jgi:hypothetical protein
MFLFIYINYYHLLSLSIFVKNYYTSNDNNNSRSSNDNDNDDNNNNKSKRVL